MSQVHEQSRLMVDAALAWADRGVPVFPVQGKVPRVPWSTEATTDPHRIEDWWSTWPDAGIGGALGQACGAWVLDIDGDEGRASLAALEHTHGPLPDTMLTRTGSGGEHRWFRMPSGIDVRNSASKVAPKIDVRGSGGLVVLPPSLHPCGRRYELASDDPIVDAPQWLLDLVAGPRPRAQNAPVVRLAVDPLRDKQRVLGMVRAAADRIRGAMNGSRNDTINRECYNVGGWLASVGLTPDFVAAELVAAADHVDPERARDNPGIVLRALQKGAESPRELPPQEERARPVPSEPPAATIDGRAILEALAAENTNAEAITAEIADIMLEDDARLDQLAAFWLAAREAFEALGMRITQRVKSVRTNFAKLEKAVIRRANAKASTAALHPDLRVRINHATGATSVEPSFGNLLTILEHDPRWKGRVQFCEFTLRVLFCGRDLADTDEGELAAALERSYGVEFQLDKVHRALVTVAQRHPFHPVRRYLDGLRWDGVPRLEGWTEAYAGTARDKIGYGWRFLVSAVARIYEPGAKVDSALILRESTGGTAKSTIPSVLASEEWFSDTPLAIGTKDGYSALAGVWIYELGELSVLQTANFQVVKNFLSSPQDRYRPPYARNDIRAPRQTVFFGTTNDAVFIPERGGIRRFWVLEVVGQPDIAGLRRDRDQLWAEAVHRYRAGFPWHLTDKDAEEQQRLEASSYTPVDTWAEELEPWLVGRKYVMVSQVLEHLQVTTDRRSRALETRATELLASLGWVRPRKKWTPPGAGQQQWWWGHKGDPLVPG